MDLKFPYYIAPYLDESTKDLKNEDQVFYYLINGKKSDFTGWCNDRYYVNGKTATGIYNELYIKNGLLTTGVYENKFYQDGLWQSDLTDVYWIDNNSYGDTPSYKDNILQSNLGYYIKNGIVQIDFTGIYNNYFIVNGEIGTGIYEDKFYRNGILENKLSISSLVNCNYPEKNVIYISGNKIANFTGNQSGYYIKNGIWQSDFNGSYNNIYYINGKIATGIYENKYYKNGVLQSNFTGIYENKYYIKDGIWQPEFTGEIQDKYGHNIYVCNGLAFIGILNNYFYEQGEKIKWILCK